MTTSAIEKISAAGHLLARAAAVLGTLSPIERSALDPKALHGVHVAVARALSQSATLSPDTRKTLKDSPPSNFDLTSHESISHAQRAKLSDWHLTGPDWWCKAYGDDQVHLQRDADHGWMISHRWSGDLVDSPSYESSADKAIDLAIAQFAQFTSIETERSAADIVSSALLYWNEDAYRHGDAAAQEGWQLSTSSHGSELGPLCVSAISAPARADLLANHPDRYPQIAVLADDDQARALVREGTEPHHLAAREVLLAHNPVELALVMEGPEDESEHPEADSLAPIFKG